MSEPENACANPDCLHIEAHHWHKSARHCLKARCYCKGFVADGGRPNWDVEYARIARGVAEVERRVEALAGPVGVSLDALVKVLADHALAFVGDDYCVRCECRWISRPVSNSTVAHRAHVAAVLSERFVITAREDV